MHTDFYIFACFETTCTIDYPVCRDNNMVGKQVIKESSGTVKWKLVHQKLQKLMNKPKLFMLD